MLPKDWWDSFCLKMEKSSIGKPLTCGLSLTQLEFPLRTSLPGNYNLIFIRFNFCLKMFCLTVKYMTEFYVGDVLQQF